ncbi:carnitine dehydratase [Gammaproteobacteria bacterium 45_16_T64]|nr:carnitine dehydratase [Gammaproteobacteria bacterium 45_16_T64]
MSNDKPLEGVRVLELGQLLAGPFAGTLLGYYGAEVIKVEPPGKGDPIRQWREVKDGTSLWWRSLGRNKKCVTLDLKSEKGREIVKSLILKSDVVIENFRPGTMEKWGLGPEVFESVHPDLVYTRISGYGQTGPLSQKPGFASVCEGFSGFRAVNGFPGEAPVRPNLSMGDSLAGLHAAFGIVLALIQRNKAPENSGQVVDVALYESMYNMMEGVVPEYDGAGAVRQPSGTTVTGIVPTNTYRCGDSKYIVIGGNGDSIFVRLMKAIGREDLATDPRVATNQGRVDNEQEIDDALSQWTNRMTSDEALSVLEDARVPSGPIFNVEDMMEDEHYKARDMFESVDINGEPLKIPAIVPKLVGTPGETQWPGPEVGEYNTEVYGDVLGLSEEEILVLKETDVI